MTWTVPRIWEGDTAFIVCGGPSVRGLDLSLLWERRVIAVNSSYLSVPFADFLFFCDLRWWKLHEEALQTFPGEIVTNGPVIPMQNTRRPLVLRRSVPDDGALSLDPTRVVVGKTSTHGAINLAVLLGAARIVLLGADMGAAPDGATHHHPAHPWPQKPGCWDEQMKELRGLEEPLRTLGISVLNASPFSRIDWWPKATYEECLWRGPTEASSSSAAAHL